MLLCQFLVLAGNRLWFYILPMYLGVSCHKVVLLCLFFWFWQEIVFGVLYIWYVLYTTVLWLCQFLVLAGNRFWFYILMYLEYNAIVVLCYFLVLAGNSY